jgi:WD40 repeat protein
MEKELPPPVKFGALSVTQIPVKEAGEHIYAVAYSPDGKFVAATFGNGVLRVFNATTFEPIQRAKLGSGFDDLPSTGVAWRPPHDDVEEGIYELVTVSSVGAVFGWNLDVSDPESIFLDRVWKCVEEGNETAAVDYAPDGSLLATVGSDRIVRTYSPVTRKLVAALEKGKDEAGHTRAAHTNRVFSIRFATPFLMLTGGWEAPVQVWDIRTGFSERQISGPQISSDGIETTVGSQSFLTVSKRDTKQLQVWDVLSGRENERESEKLSANVGKNALIAARFAPESMLIWTATTKPDELLCLDSTTGEVKGHVAGGHFGNILCLQRCPTMPKRVLVGGMKEGLYVVDCA